MQRLTKYRIQDLEDKSKKIKIISFYNNQVEFFGYYKDLPERFLTRYEYFAFIPRSDYYEFTTY